LGGRANEQTASVMMFEFSGYAVTKLVHHGPRSVFYRATATSDGRTVLIKVPVETVPRVAQIRTLHREWELLQLLAEAKGVAQAIELRRDADRYGIVLADDASVPLHRFRPADRPSVDLLDVAIGMCDALAQVHAQGVTHKC